jgi:hypothetical protein
MTCVLVAQTLRAIINTPIRHTPQRQLHDLKHLALGGKKMCAYIARTDHEG